MGPWEQWREWQGAEGKRPSAGLLLLAPVESSGPTAGRSRFLLLRRASHIPAGGQWNLPGGRIEPGETAWEAALREANEEAGYDPEAHGMVPLGVKARQETRGKVYITFAVGVDGMFIPRLNSESNGWTWVTLPAALALDTDTDQQLRLHRGLRSLLRGWRCPCGWGRRGWTPQSDGKPVCTWTGCIKVYDVGPE